MDSFSRKHSDALKNLKGIKNTIIHKFAYKDEILFLIHHYSFSQFSPSNINEGKVHILFRDESDMDDAVLEYSVVRKGNDQSYIELSKLQLPQRYFGIGIGSILMSYLEVIIAGQFLKDIKYVRGITIIGDFSLKRFYQKHGYVFNNFSIVKELKS